MDLKTLELDKVLSIVTNSAICDITKERILMLEPNTSLDEVKTLLEHTEEFRNVIVKLGSIPIYTLVNTKEALSRCQKGSLLYQDELLNISNNIETVSNLKGFRKRIADEKISADFLVSLIDGMTFHSKLFTEIRNVVDLRGNIMDTASSELNRIRRNIKNAELSIKEKLTDIIHKERAKLNDTVVTIKGDRPTLMVKNEYKNTFRGVVWGESSSGESTFIEPYEISEMSLKINSLKHEEEREIYNILKALTALVFELVDELIICFDTLLEIDFINAKAMYAKSINAFVPALNDKGVIRLVRAAHPLLNQDTCVRNSIIIDKYQGLIITGPNTGGKTVALKTTGLLTLMTQCGLLIPVAPESEVAIFDRVFADIGDEQSIEQSLSTFSSHMKNIVRILDDLTTSSLVLLDELGSGTDPNEGANLAISIIDYLVKRNVRLIATTHYSKLKAYALENPYVENASVEFDVETLSPTYKLLIGVPGKSNAYAISRSLGLSAEIISNAKSLVDENDNITNLMSKVEIKSVELEKAIEENYILKVRLENKQLELDTRLAEVKERENRANEIATKEAKDIISKAKQEAVVLLDELKELKNRGFKEHELASAKTKYNKLSVEQKELAKEDDRPLEVGDIVNVLAYNKHAELVKKSGNTWTVNMGSLTLKVEEDRLEFVKKNTKQKAAVVNVKAKANKRVPLEIDLRGQRFDEARMNLEKYLDDCVVANNPRATIIHGYGTGTIDKVVQEVIKKNKFIVTSRKGDHGEGGGGVTVVYFKD